MLGNDIDMNFYDLLAVGFQTIFLVIFLVPTQSILRKHWHHLDGFSKWMITIYILDMVCKLVFFVLEYFIEDQPNSQSESRLIERSLMRAALYIINSLFLLSLHMFV